MTTAAISPSTPLAIRPPGVIRLTGPTHLALATADAAGTVVACDVEGGEMLNIKVWTWALGTWGAVSFVVCVLWGVFTPAALHMHGFLESVLPGFRWLTVGGFAVGLVESFLYGAYAGLLFVPLHNFFHRRWGASR